MRTLVAAALIALLAGAAFAQGVGGKRRAQPRAEQTKKDVAKKKAAEKAYNDALGKIPESKEKLDPWKAMR
jgi:hypothetical protein